MANVYIPAWITETVVQLWMTATMLLIMTFAFFRLVNRIINDQKEQNTAVIKAIDSLSIKLCSEINNVSQTLKDHSDWDEKQMEKIIKEFWKIANTKLSDDMVKRVIDLEMADIAEQKREFIAMRLDINHFKERPEAFEQDIKEWLSTLTGKYRANFRKIKTDIWNLDDWYIQRGFPNKDFEVFFKEIMEILTADDTKENKLLAVEQKQNTVRHKVINKYSEDSMNWILVSNLTTK